MPEDVTASDVAVSAARRLRLSLSRYLLGEGVELGPGHCPFPIVLPGTRVQYVDRWQPSENEALFPELGQGAGFPKPHHVANLDTDRLGMLEDQSQDFVIASHVLEHVAEPIGLLDEIHRVLRPGGVVLILLPDRRRTFDRHRPPTTLDHLVAEYEGGVTEVDDDHVLEFLQGTAGTEVTATVLEDTVEDHAALLELHRRRSIHVHCWTDEEFLPVLIHSIVELGHGWVLLDAVVAEDGGPASIEFGYVLATRNVELDPAVLARRLEETWRMVIGARQAARLAPVVVEPSLPPGSRSGPAGWRRLVVAVARRVISRVRVRHRA